MLGMLPMQVDHQLVSEQHGNKTIHLVEIDPVAMQALGLDVVQRAPNSIAHQRLVGQMGPYVGVDSRAFCALALHAPRQEATSSSMVELPSCFTPPKSLLPKDRYSLEVVVGNHYKGVSEQATGDLFHEGTLYVTLPEFQASKWRTIEYVVYNLHLGCSPGIYTKHSPELELTILSKETFTVTCTIHWNPTLGLQPTVVGHDLVFAEVGGHTSVTVGVSPRRLQFCA
jgi:hypothetical protein